MPTPARFVVCLLPLVLCACHAPPLQGSYHCSGDVKFSFNRQSQSVVLSQGGKSYQGVMDEKRELTWPQAGSSLALPDTYALSRQDPKQLTLYGGFAGKGLACQHDS